MGLLDRALNIGEQKQFREYQRRVAQIGGFEPELELESDEELRARMDVLRERAQEGESLDDLLPECFAIVREVGKRTMGMRHFDVQLIGGMVLHGGNIAEMKTGEGKTLTATLAVVLNSLPGKGVHVVTVNDYLARRDADWMSPIYNALGVNVGVLQNMQSYEDKHVAYAADVTYGTNSEFGFDYLHDNMATAIEEKHKTVAITERGVAKAERFLGIDHLYRAENGHLVNHLIQSLKAESLYKNDVDYAVIDGEVKIIDEFTGRILEGRRWSEGLHQAVEAKEGVAIQEENQTLATITLQNYFRMYDKLAGMTGTALTEATEFMKIYKLPVVEIPTNRPMVRADRNDQIFKTKDGKWSAVVREITERNETGQPVLVGTISVEVSELLSQRLAKLGLKPGDPDYDERSRDVLPSVEARVEQDREAVLEAGGLFICGTERHESRRIDNQLRGRSGRQGDPGESRFFLSAEDDLVRLFAGDRIY